MFKVIDNFLDDQDFLIVRNYITNNVQYKFVPHYAVINNMYTQVIQDNLDDYDPIFTSLICKGWHFNPVSKFSGFMIKSDQYDDFKNIFIDKAQDKVFKELKKIHYFKKSNFIKHDSVVCSTYVKGQYTLKHEDMPVEIEPTMFTLHYYLDDSKCGNKFYFSKNDTEIVESKKNRAVLFKSDLPHEVLEVESKYRRVVKITFMTFRPEMVEIYKNG